MATEGAGADRVRARASAAAARSSADRVSSARAAANRSRGVGRAREREFDEAPLRYDEEYFQHALGVYDMPYYDNQQPSDYRFAWQERDILIPDDQSALFAPENIVCNVFFFSFLLPEKTHRKNYTLKKNQIRSTASPAPRSSRRWGACSTAVRRWTPWR